jgi:hypothetical protein
MLRIRDGYDFQTGGVYRIFSCDSGELQIIGPEDRVLYSIRLAKDDLTIEIRGGDKVKRGDVLYDRMITVVPESANCVHITRRLY